MAHYQKWVFSLAGLMLLASCGGEAGIGEQNASPAVQTTGINNGLDNIAIGDMGPVSFSGSRATVDFGKPSPNDQYLLVISSTSKAAADYTIQISGSASTPPPSLVALNLEEPEESGESQFHQYLREWEEIIPDSDDFREVHYAEQAALSSSPAAGDVKSFRVLSTINSVTSFKEISATLRLATNNLYIYVDQEAQSHISDKEIQALASDFEDIAIPLERNLFGNESDINNDGHISILMTPVLNRMSSSGGIVTGFFYPGDLYRRAGDGSSGGTTAINSVSNEQEIFYTMVPDAKGEFGTPISSAFTINNILPGVLAHEYQHMISFNQHVFVNGGPTEAAWLNEAMSHLTEDVTGFGNENPSRVKLFLSQTSKSPLIPSTSPGLAERGGSYLFLRYLYEQSSNGPAFLKALETTGKTGVSNLESSFAGSDPAFSDFAGFLKRWSLALALSETGMTSDSRYNYEAREAHPKTGNFTGACIRCDTQDGRGTVLGGPVMTTPDKSQNGSALKASASQFYQLTGAQSALQISGTEGANLAGTLIRLKKK